MSACGNRPKLPLIRGSHRQCMSQLLEPGICVVGSGQGAIAAAIGAIFYFYKFVTDPNPAGGHTSGWIALGLAAVAFVCGLIYFLGHVNKEEEIHITQ